MLEDYYPTAGEVYRSRRSNKGERVRFRDEELAEIAKFIDLDWRRDEREELEDAAE